ncbi:HSF-type DNA-binding (Partial), partial [Seminavis robusta]|eukprot:Sro1974_g308750.1 HSF-type DNA-binding (549) ;mRNA; f:18114-19998
MPTVAYELPRCLGRQDAVVRSSAFDDVLEPALLPLFAHIPSAPKPKVAGKVLSAKFEMTKRPKKRRPKMAWEIYQEQRLSEQCLGKTFPEQLMLLMNSSVASGKMWWTADGGGKTFAFDLAFFKDDVMNMFFPPNHLRRITVMLTRWEFKRVMQPDLPKHFLAYQHPNFDRFKPEMASEIVLKCKGAFELALEREEEDRRRLFQGIRKQREQGDGMLLPVHKSAAAVEQFISNSMRKVEQGRKEKGLDKILFQQRTHPLQRKQVTKAVRPRVKKPEKARVPPSVLIASLRRDESHGHDKASVAPPSVRIAALRRDCPPKNVHWPLPRQASLVNLQFRCQRPNPTKARSQPESQRHALPRETFSQGWKQPGAALLPASSVKKAPPPPASVEIIDVDAPTPEPSRDINRGKRRKNSIRLPPRPVQPAVAVAVAEPPRPEQHGFERRSAQSGLHLRQSHILRGKAIPTTLANLQQTPRKRLGMTWDDPSLGTPDSAESPKKTNELAQRLANNRDVGTNSIRRTSLASSRRLSAQEQVALAEEQRALKRQKQM